MLPIVAGILAGRGAAIGWSGAVVLVLLGMSQAERIGLLNPVPVSEATYLPSLISILAIACAAAAAAVVLYETTNLNLRRNLEDERQKLRYAAGHDPLTDLPNRRLFEELQQHALQRATRSKQKAALFVIDLDGFKPINDAYGHAAGDDVLQTVATRLREFTRATDSVARLGGDEFAILVEFLDSVETAALLASRLSETLMLQVEPEPGVSAEVSSSIGVALFPDHADTAEGLNEAADLAMYAAKAEGGDQHCVFDERLL